MVRLTTVIKTFANTFRELHYLAIGFVAGYITAVWVGIKRERYRYETRGQYR